MLNNNSLSGDGSNNENSGGIQPAGFSEDIKSAAAPELAMERLYRKMVEEVSDYALLLLDTDGNILNWNPGAAGIKGYTAEEIIGRNFRTFYTAADQGNGLPETLLEQARIEGKAVHEGWRVKKDGARFWGSVIITALHEDNGELIGFSKLTRDLTERKAAEEWQLQNAKDLEIQNEALRKSEERYHRMIAEVSDYAIILLDIDGNILNWNRGAESIKGYTEREILGKNFRNFYLPEDRRQKLPEQLLEEAITHNKATHEGWRLRKDGTHFWGSIVITALHDERGNITGFSKVTRDLTREKESEGLILLKNSQLEEYAYAASHDLQEPLRKIMLFGNLLKKNMGNEKAEGYLDKINISAERMSNLIRAVLQYSQTTAADELKIAVDLNSVLRDIETDFELLLEEKKGHIFYDNLPVIHAIPIQMHQLFSNLIGNAIKFCDHAPKIDINADTSLDGNNNKFIHIRVTDNGRGFDQEHADKIFRMFHRLHDHAQGTGIGLALCKRIVENHGGTITAGSQPGQGAAFDIFLPVP